MDFVTRQALPQEASYLSELALRSKATHDYSPEYLEACRSALTITEEEIGTWPVIRMAVVALLTAIVVLVFYKELLVSSFDSGLAASLGINPTFVHYGLMCWLSVVVLTAEWGR